MIIECLGPHSCFDWTAPPCGFGPDAHDCYAGREQPAGRQLGSAPFVGYLRVGLIWLIVSRMSYEMIAILAVNHYSSYFSREISSSKYKQKWIEKDAHLDPAGRGSSGRRQ